MVVVVVFVVVILQKCSTHRVNVVCRRSGEFFSLSRAKENEEVR